MSELVHGRTLAELLQAGAVSDRDVARIGVVLCDALEHAHARGVVHRDVKPQNVMVVAEPAAGAGFAKLADFGVAHVASGDPLTHTGDVIGTLAYMAPEQAEGGPITSASDVYSLALTLYEAWTGQNPVRAGGLAATARRLGPARCPRSHSAGRTFRMELCYVLDDALAVDPAYRPRPAELRVALADAERHLSDDGGLVEPATLRRVGLPTAATRGRFGRRRRGQVEPGPPVPLAGRALGRAEAPRPDRRAGRAGSRPAPVRRAPAARRAAWPRGRSRARDSAAWSSPGCSPSGTRPRSRPRRSPARPRWPRPSFRASAGSRRRSRSAAGSPRSAAGPAPRSWSSWRRWRFRCSSRAPACSGRCPRSPRCSACLPSPRPSWRWPPWRRRSGAGPGWPPREPSGCWLRRR